MNKLRHKKSVRLGVVYYNVGKFIIDERFKNKFEDV